jgi:hypothetical protein
VVRTVTERVRSNPTQFGEVEIHPRTLLALAVDGWSGWLEEHLRPVPELMGRYGVGFPLATAEIRFRRPFTFLTANSFSRETAVVFRRPRNVTVSCDTVFRYEAGGRTEDFAEVRLTATVSRFTPGTLCAAGLGALPAELLARLGPDEQGADRRHSALADRVARLESTAKRLADDHHRTVTAHRHLCEPGDQWTFVPVPDLLAEAREALLLAAEATAPQLLGTLALGHRELTFDLHQPLGLLETARLTTTAYQGDAGPAFVHRVTSARGEPHAVALETLESLTPGGPPW